MAIIQGNTGIWEYVIGLEIHAQVISNSKLFSGSSTEFGAEPNSHVSLVDAAMPGMLPVLNEYCVRQAVKTGLGVGARISHYSAFDRKNYFYPDLPQGYQISQFYHPIVIGGVVDIKTEDGAKKSIRIHHIHLEQDAGKSMHDQSPTSSFIDLNRCGIALMEVVSEPDMSSPEEAAEYVKKLRSLFRYLGTCDGDMEKGSMRCDANVSVRRPGAELGTRCEIKNINSIKNIVRAIEYEAMRQVELLESGGTVSQETRLFDADDGTTRTMRSKEDAHDYRYFPEPDLLPIILNDEYVASVLAELPELPEKKIERYINNLGLSQYDAEVIVSDKATADYFEEIIAKTDAKLAANWLTGELFAGLNKASIEIDQCKITPLHLAMMINLIVDGTISGKIAKQVFEEMFDSGANPEAIIKEKGLVQISDDASIQKIIDEVMQENQDSVDAYRGGRVKLFGFFVGQVMQKTGGKANPVMLNDLLKAALDG